MAESPQQRRDAGRAASRWASLPSHRPSRGPIPANAWLVGDPFALERPPAGPRARASGRSTLVLNPPDDPRFAEVVNRIAAHDALDPATLQRLLRDHYPRAVVHRRELSDEPIEVWYVYRDGHWVPASRTKES